MSNQSYNNNAYYDPTANNQQEKMTGSYSGYPQGQISAPPPPYNFAEQSKVPKLPPLPPVRVANPNGKSTLVHDLRFRLAKKIQENLLVFYSDLYFLNGFTLFFDDWFS